MNVLENLPKWQTTIMMLLRPGKRAVAAPILTINRVRRLHGLTIKGKGLPEVAAAVGVGEGVVREGGVKVEAGQRALGQMIGVGARGRMIWVAASISKSPSTLTTSKTN
jgi:hypothetical protein